MAIAKYAISTALNQADWERLRQTQQNQAKNHYHLKTNTKQGG